jgi:hypothetical protein
MYMLLAHYQNAGQTHDINIANRCFEIEAEFIYLGNNQIIILLRVNLRGTTSVV